MKRYKILFLIITTLVYACKEGTDNNLIEISPEAEKTFNALVNTQDINQSMKVSVLENTIEEYKNSSEIEILIENTTSNKFIYFNPEEVSAIQLLLNIDNNWLPVNNKDKYIGNGVISPNGVQGLPRWKTGIRPEVNPIMFENSNYLLIRILISGEFISTSGEKSGEKVAAYVDILLIP